VDVLSRPAALADNYTTTKEVVRHFIETEGLPSTTVVCCLAAVAPFLQVKHLHQAKDLLQEDNFVFDCQVHEKTVHRSFTIDNGKSKMLFPEHMNTRTQDLPMSYYNTGMLCFATVKTWMDEKRSTLEGGRPLIVTEKTVDIDTVDEWERAEKLFQN